MLNATQPPRRMRFSFESRCRVVSLVLAGQSPQAAAAACGASRYRLWRRYQEGSWSALADRRPQLGPRGLGAEQPVEVARGVHMPRIVVCAITVTSSSSVTDEGTESSMNTSVPMKTRRPTLTPRRGCSHARVAGGSGM